MCFEPKNIKKIKRLIEKGVAISNPSSVDIGNEVNIDQISGNGVKIYPGCRIYGEETVICSDSVIGSEGPVTIDNCQLGTSVKLKGGYFTKSTFLDKSNMGFGAQVRQGCILEEEANGAHCVGLKQTILFPFVTLGSLINFCDCLMAGGTSRKIHSEVGSSYIHFNYTPDSNKSTASLIGDVPRGVMLDQPTIFLGGQGGIVGPIRIEYGTVVAAGSVLRKDILEANKLVIGDTYPGTIKDFIPNMYKRLSRLICNNIVYIANLLALEQWYVNIRKPFFDKHEFGQLLYDGVMNKLSLAKQERIKRLKILVGKLSGKNETELELKNNIDNVCSIFEEELSEYEIIEIKTKFLNEIKSYIDDNNGDYITVIQSLSEEITVLGKKWLQQIINTIFNKTSNILKSLDMKYMVK